MRNSMTSQIGDNFGNFKNNMMGAQGLSQELQERTERIKQMIDYYDELSEKLETIEEKYKEKSKHLFDTDKVTTAKNALAKIKKELFDMNVQVGVYRGTIITEQLKEGGNAFEMYNHTESNSHHEEQKHDDSFEI